MIYLELVPTSISELKDHSKWATSNFRDILGINVPDILRVQNRSYSAVSEISNMGIDAIPHIRACDFSKEDLLVLCNNLKGKGIKNILIVSGDPPPNLLQPVFKHNLIDVFRMLTYNISDVHFYAGHDPYRQSLKDEYNYSKEKIKAGAKGLFTQPIFDLNLAKLLLNLDIECEWFIGISPVLSDPSYNYWTTRNNVVFNADFNLTLDYNIKIGKELINYCKEKNQHNYIMPIKTDLKTYLGKLFK